MGSIRFTIFPTTESGLSASTYRVSLPAPEQWSVLPERQGESTITLSGAKVHSVWPLNVTTAQPEYSQVITDVEFKALLVLVEHATVTTWMLNAEGRSFEVAIFLQSAVRVWRSGAQKWQVQMSFRIIREA